MRQRGAARKLILLLTAAALCFGLALYFGASRTSAEREHGNHDWLHHGNDLANTRFQNLDQINPSNVKNLKVAWVFHTGVLDPLAELEATPIEVDGRLFITDGHDNVFALNAATGKQLWKLDGFNDEAQLAAFFLCCGRNNHGVAYGGGTVFVGRFDDSVVALSAESGKVVWCRCATNQSTLADFHDRVSINSAPQFVKFGGRELVIISLSGGEYEIRGQVFALDAKTGKTVWHFSTTQPDSFAGNSFQSGGAAVWVPPAIDPDLGLVYLSVGNAAPDIRGEERAGDNLFAASIVAIKLSDGNPAWHFQEVHHDIWDYDSAQPAVLFPLEKGGTQFKALGHCSKNGQYYILDRSTGEPLYQVTEKPVPSGAAFQNAASTQPYSAVEPLTLLSFDQLTPEEQPDTATINRAFSSFFAPGQTSVTLSPQYTPPDDTLRLIMPGDNGGCEWAPAAYSPRTKYVYYGARQEPDVFKTHSGNTSLVPQAVNGDLHLGSQFINHVPGVKPFGMYGATDTQTGKVVWKIQIPQPAKSGVLVAGDLVFFGEGNGTFDAADARTGKPLFSFNAPSNRSNIANVGGAAAGPMAYLVDGREFVVNAFGGNVPDRTITADGDCLGGGSICDNPVGDAYIAFALSTDEKEKETEKKKEKDKDKDKDKDE
jgi:glucose dehydrogenase